jgi:hypothetical protein
MAGSARSHISAVIKAGLATNLAFNHGSLEASLISAITTHANPTISFIQEWLAAIFW